MSDNSPKGTARAVLAAAACLALALAGCAGTEDSRIRVSGTVVDDVTTVAVPYLPMPAPDPLVGTSAAQETTVAPSPQDAEEVHDTALVGASGSTAPRTSAATQWQRITEVLVRPGQRVKAGDVIARLDSTAASVTIAAAAADLRRAEADVALIASRTADVSQGRTDVASETADIEQTIATLETQRADVQRQLDTVRASLPVTGSVDASIPPAIETSIAQLETTLIGLDTALAEAQAGLESLREASTSLLESESALASVKTVAEAMLDVRRATLALVEAQSDMATVTAPVEGTVLEMAAVGDVLASGAPLARLRPSARPRVRTYLTTEQARSLRSSASAQVSLDSLPARTYVALLSAVGTRQEYVPTTFATKIIHLSRGVEVVFEVYDAAALPAGTPVDLVIDPD